MPTYVFEVQEFSAPEVSDLWAVPERTIREWAKTGVLRAKPKQGRCRWRFTWTEVLRATPRLSRRAAIGGRYAA